MALTKDQILAADDLGLLEVKVKEWGGSVHLRVMTVAERDAHELEWLNNKEKGVANFRTKFLESFSTKMIQHPKMRFWVQQSIGVMLTVDCNPDIRQVSQK